MSLYDKIRIFICPFQNILDFIPENSKILDIGCGRGTFFRNFLSDKNFVSYKGIDIHAKSIKRLSYLNSNNVIFSVSGIKDVIKELNFYNCILLIDVMHHIQKKNQQKIIEQMINNLNDNSILIYKDISSSNMIKSFINFIHDLIFSFQIINYYNIDKIERYVKNKTKVKIEKKFIIKKFWYDHEFLILKK